MADVIVDQNSFATATGDYPVFDLTEDAHQRVCQIFTASASYVLTKIGIKGREVNTCPGNAQVEIFDGTGDEPSGSALDTAVVVASTFPTLRNWVYFTMTGGVSIVSGSKYAIVVSALAGLDTNYLEITYTGDKVTGGLLTTVDLGETWDDTYFATYDLNFRAYYTEDTTFVDITGTVAGISSISGTLSISGRLYPPTVTYFYSVTGQYYRLLVKSDGTYGDPPGVGTENVDYVYLAAGYEPNFIKTTRKLVAVAKNTFYYEGI